MRVSRMLKSLKSLALRRTWHVKANMTIGTLSIKLGPLSRLITQLMPSGRPFACAIMSDRMLTAITRKMIDRTPRMDENCRLLMSLSSDSGSMMVAHEMVMRTHLSAKTLPTPKYSCPSGVTMSPSVTRYATEMPKQKTRMFSSTKMATWGKRTS
jgi:hypothetical protein